MLTLLLTTALLISPIQDIQAFRDVFAMRKSDQATEAIDPAIVKCMDMIALKLLAEVRQTSSPIEVKEVLSGFSEAVKQEETFETSFRSFGASISIGSGRTAIGVRMGAVGRLKVFNTSTGKPIPVPKALEWSYQFDVKPHLLFGGMLVVDGAGIQDAGVRYGYRILFLRIGKSGYSMGKSMRGVWTLSDDSESHFRMNGLTASVNTIEQPTAFFTNNSARLFERNTIYELDKWPIRVRMTSMGSAAIRAVDKWMSEAIANPVTPDQKRFVEAYGKERLMIDTFTEKVISEDKFEVTLKFEKSFVFSVLMKGRTETVVLIGIEGR